ncbi:MAG: SpoIID/LytB domain-containing protein [Bacillota bacterium]
MGQHQPEVVNIKPQRFILMTVIAALLLMVVGLRPTQADPLGDVRVGIGIKQSTLRISGSGAYQIINSRTGGVVLSSGGGNAPDMTLSNGAIKVAGIGTFSGPLVVRPASESGRLWFSGRAYRGWFEVHASSGGLTLVNVLPLEHYLYGVVPREMPADFPAEALKVQAVAARTYAVYSLNNRKYTGEPYDLLATVSSQVYGGATSEDWRTNAAVDATRGEILVYGGAAIPAFFHSTSGGHTENVGTIWSGNQPYLVGKPDYDQDSPHYAWIVNLSISETEQKLAQAGFDIGRLQDIVPGEAGVSGRLKTITVVGDRASFSMKGEEFRFALGLKSSSIRVTVSQGGVVEAVTPVEGAIILAATSTGTRVNRNENLYVIGAGSQPQVVSGLMAVARRSVTPGVNIEGNGWGHGVGMSQWGARGLALLGHNYREILAYYYEGVELITR